jgi:hypothetical protein
MDVSEQHILPIYKDQAVQEERLALEDRADNFSPNIGNKELFFLRGLIFEYGIYK